MLTTTTGIVAAGFYKFIKVLEYETANPGQDLDHAQKVEKKRQLLVAAGLPQREAEIVAADLATAPAEAGGMNGNVMANAQGRKSAEADPNGMYGSNFRNNSIPTNTHHVRSDSSSDETYVSSPTQAQMRRPQAVSTGSAVGRLGFLRDAAQRASYHSDAPIPDARMSSPAMATHEEIYAPLANGPAEALGGSVHPENEPRLSLIHI